MGEKLAIALLGTAVFLPSAGAQAQGGHAPARFGIASGANPGTTQRFNATSGPGVRFHHPAVSLSPAYFYADYAPAPAITEASPQIVVVQAPAATEAATEAKGEPLLIEWQGDRYVRLGGAEGAIAHGTSAPLDYAEGSPKLTAPPMRSDRPPAAVPVLPPAVLVYRDGHHEAVRDYTIVDGAIYARGDYWTDGFWNKKIQLNTLNLPATLKASAENGVKFVLPSSPNEVVTRP